MYLYAPSLLSSLIAALHTWISVQVIVYSLRSNKAEDDLKDISPILAFNMALKFKDPEPNYYNQVKISCLSRTVCAFGSEFIALST